MPGRHSLGRAEAIRGHQDDRCSPDLFLRAASNRDDRCQTRTICRTHLDPPLSFSHTDKSWKDTAQSAVSDAAKTVRGIKSIHVKNLEAVAENDKITQYRINGKISFMVEST